MILGDTGGDGENFSNSGCILKVEPTGFSG